MGRIEQLVENYGRFAALPWEQNLAGAQRVWFAVYDKTDERRLRIRLGEFELATKSTKHGWKLVDVAGAFAEWMAAEDYREDYFKAPDDLEMAMSGFLDFVSARVKSALDDEVPFFIVPTSELLLIGPSMSPLTSAKPANRAYAVV